MKNKIILSSILIIFCFLLQAQSITKKWEHSNTYHYYGIHEGLPHLQVFRSFQDSNGYLWVSTGAIDRFDGTKFVHFNLKELKIELQNCIIYNIFEHDKAIILISAHNVTFIYPDQNIESYPLPESYSKYSYVAEILDNSIYLFNCHNTSEQNNNPYALIKFELKSKTFSLVAEDLPLLNTNVLDKKIYAVSDGIINNHKINLYSVNNDTIKKIFTQSLEPEISAINFLERTKENDFYGTFTKGKSGNKEYFFCQFFIENDTIRWKKLTTVPYFANSIVKWDKNHLILGFKNSFSAHILDLNTCKLSPYPFGSNEINHIYVDREQNFWLSTEDGLYMYPRNKFESYKLGLGKHDEILSIIEDSQHNIWFSASKDGFWRADTQGVLHKIAVYSAGKILSEYYGCVGTSKDNKGKVFLSVGTGTVIYDPSNGNPNQIIDLLTGGSWYSYYDTYNNCHYFGGRNDNNTTLNRRDDNGNITVYNSEFQNITSICRDGNQILRIGTFETEAYLDETTQSVVFDASKGLYNGVLCMVLDDKNTLWKGTYDGLFAENKEGENQQTTEAIAIMSLLNYDNRYIIFTTAHDIHMLDLQAYYESKKFQIRSFGYFDGFDVLECALNGTTIDHEGYVWASGLDKAIRFHPDKIMEIPPIQSNPPSLASIWFASKNDTWSKLEEGNIKKLENKENNLRFDILSASLSAPRNLIFRYKLSGYNDSWIVSKDRSFVYQNLPYGKYQIEVQSSIDDGVEWSESILSPVITINRPFLLTFPGLLLILMGIVVIVTLIIYFTRKIIIRKAEEKREIEQLKYKAIRAKFIPHFTGNVLNSINYLISQEHDMVQQYISDFSDFSQQTLRNSENLFRTIQEELEYVELYLKLEKLRFEEKLMYEISVDQQVNLLTIVPSMSLQTFCENALKHGLRSKQGDWKILISVYKQENHTILAVEDNGIGRKEAQTIKTEGTKEGLKIVQQQLDVLNKKYSQKAYLQIVDLYDEEGIPKGTRVILFF
ncbi:histidine kinase [Bacteroidales bacterium OttesenSCG-928-K22]|nr:histidine kinase [Bacteroidales bacterium OttesenSCG-928-K22]